MNVSTSIRHLTSLYELRSADVEEILGICSDLKAEYRQGARPALLQGRVLVQIFDKPSLRTRLSFEAAIMQLGGSATFLSTTEAGLKGRESLPDVARVLGSYVDAVVIRTFSQSLIDDFAGYAECPVINGLSDDKHPCQALTDLMTIREVFGSFDGRRLVYVGDGNNMAASLAIAAALVGLKITICSPPDYQLNDEFLDDLKQRISAADVSVTTDPQAAVRDADVVYTDVWASMGQEAESDARKQAFAAYQINADLMSQAPEECRFMHCLPARRGTEVTDEVMDSPRSIVFQQAENRMHLAKGLLAWIMQVR
jgi:ornithine carbamoyltransferase